jgi:hypothetical protein
MFFLNFLNMFYPDVQGQLFHCLCVMYVAVFQDEQLDSNGHIFHRRSLNINTPYRRNVKVNVKCKVVPVLN